MPWLSPRLNDGFLVRSKSAVPQWSTRSVMIRSTPLDGYCGCSRAIMGLKLTEQIASITLPTLLMVGRDDPGTPVAAHETIQQQIAGSELVVIPDALHFSNIEQREPSTPSFWSFSHDTVDPSMSHDPGRFVGTL